MHIIRTIQRKCAGGALRFQIVDYDLMTWLLFFAPIGKDIEETRAIKRFSISHVSLKTF